MGATRRKFTLEFKTEAAHRVIDSGRTVREVSVELSVHENTLSLWVRDERRRIEALEASSDVPLSTAEPETISKRTGRPDVAFAMRVTGTPTTALNGPW